MLPELANSLVNLTDPTARYAMLEAIKNNPVRIYAIASAVLALVAFYLPTIPTALILALVAAVLGSGEVVRAQVTPTRKLDSPPSLPPAWEPDDHPI